MSKIYDDITQTIGKTPLVRIGKINKTSTTILVKLESFNPLSSIKDRIGVAMIEIAEKGGLLSKNSIVIEPTSGNTGIALAFTCASKGYKLILTMPDTMSVERRKLLKALGAEIVLTEGSLGMKGAVDEAEKIKNNTLDGFIPQQFKNPANPDIHYKTTAQEIWEDTDGKIDIFISGIGTGGTITGVGKFLKEKNPNIKIMGIEPIDSPIISEGRSGPHKIQGIGAGFIPDVLDQNIVDEIIKVSDIDSGDIARRLAKEEGILAGISSGAALFVALEVAKRKESSEKVIVTILPDTGERYLSTWLFEE